MSSTPSVNVSEKQNRLDPDSSEHTARTGLPPRPVRILAGQRVSNPGVWDLHCLGGIVQRGTAAEGPRDRKTVDPSCRKS
jgi:hypothetical protein